jgi:sulfur relay (sulfurtransferase) DsrF/TusC family protein
MNVFAEVAVPTALAFASERINTERDLDMKGVEVWDKQQVEAFGEEHGYEIHTLLSRFPKDRLYIHPVKLSKWHLTVVDQ